MDPDPTFLSNIPSRSFNDSFLFIKPWTIQFFFFLPSKETLYINHFHYFNFAPGRYLPTSDPYLNTFKIRILKNWIDNPGWNAFTLITLTLMDFISTYLISFNFNFRLRIWNPFVLKFKIWIRLNTGNRYDPNR